MDLHLQALLNEPSFKQLQLDKAFLSAVPSGTTVTLLTSINPTTGLALASVACHGERDYELMVENASKAFLTWRMVPAPVRGELVRQIGLRLREIKDLLGTLVSLEMGKSKREGDGEVQEMIDMADFAVGQSRMLYGKTLHSERPLHRMYEQWHPLGVVGIITAFNFPVAVWAWNAFLALICGNTLIWKPSEKTPLCSIVVQKVCEEVMSALGYKHLCSLFITEDNALKSKMVDDTRIRLLSFTGSTRVGREVGAKVASRMGRSLLELGGNNAIIIDESANLEQAIKAVIFGSVGTTGQRCTTTRRLFVHKSIMEQVSTAIVSAYLGLKIGDPLDENNLVGPLVDMHAVAQYEAVIQRIKDLGGKILCGGKRLKGPGYFVEPTLVLASKDWDILQSETFAPILYIMSYENIHEAIQWQNEVPQGLSSSLFTQNFSHSELFLSAMGSDCGIANINIGTSGAEIGGAFGGEKETGGGREAGTDAWQAYMRRQTNTLNWGKGLPLAQGIEFEVPKT